MAKVNYHASGRVASGFTDNAGSSSERSADIFWELEPGAMIASATATAIWQLQYSLTATLFTQSKNRKLNAYTNRVDGLALWHINNRTRLQLNMTTSVGRENTNSLQTGAGSTETGIRSSGAEWLFNGALGQSLDVELTPNWTLGQGAAINSYVPLGDDDTQPQSFEVDMSVHADRQWYWGSLGALVSTQLSTSSSYILEEADTEQPASAAVSLDPQTRLISRLLARYAQPLNEFFSFTLHAGLLHAVDAKNKGDFIVHPAGSVELALFRNTTEASFQYEHTVRQSLFLADTFMLDEIRLRARHAFGEMETARWNIEGTVGYDHGLEVSLADGSIADNDLHAVLVDIALTWRMSDILGWSLRYQFNAQSYEEGSQTGEPDPLAIATVAQDYTRHVLLLSATFRYPPQRTITRTPRDRGRVRSTDWQLLFNPEGITPPPATPAQR